jgi:hypothetical protein
MKARRPPTWTWPQQEQPERPSLPTPKTRFFASVWGLVAHQRMLSDLGRQRDDHGRDALHPPPQPLVPGHRRRAGGIPGLLRREGRTAQDPKALAGLLVRFGFGVPEGVAGDRALQRQVPFIRGKAQQHADLLHRCRAEFLPAAGFTVRLGPRTVVLVLPATVG